MSRAAPIVAMALLVGACASSGSGVTAQHSDRTDPGPGTTEVSTSTSTSPSTTSTTEPSTTTTEVVTTTSTIVETTTTEAPTTTAEPTTVPPPTTSPIEAAAAVFTTSVAPYDCTYSLLVAAEEGVFGEDMGFSTEEWPLVQQYVQPAYVAHADSTAVFRDQVGAYLWPMTVQPLADMLSEDLRLEAEWFRGLGTVATLDEWDAYPEYPLTTDAAAALRLELGLPPAPEPDVALCDTVAG